MLVFLVYVISWMNSEFKVPDDEINNQKMDEDDN